MRRLRQHAAGVTLMLACLAAAAHTGGTNGFATVTVADRTVRYSLVLPLSSVPPQLGDAMRLARPDAAPDMAPLLAALENKIKLASNGRPCDPAPASAYLPPAQGGNALIVFQFKCMGPPRQLTIRDDLFDVLGPDYHTLARIESPGASVQFAFQPDARETTVSLTAAAERARGAGSFFFLGIEHILGGWDHLLFLFVLILRGGNLWSLFKILTAFTVAHSITLALAALDVVRLPERLVESVIALSIAYVAAENLFSRNALSHRWIVSFMFGLVHGFGFSNVLRELGLPTAGLVWSLLGFNLGVETGQALVALLVVPLLLWLRRYRWEPRAVASLSALVLVVGLAVFAERALV